MIRLIHIFTLLLLSQIIFSQSYPQFRSPVKHKIALSGSFGELRTGHFHAGLDIKSKRGIEGDSIFSIGAGYISRIKVEPGGYGYSIYINHPNGYTSVYAHLKEYEESIKEYVYQVQAEEMCFTIDHTPPQEAFPLAQGQLIGIMGNTGKSFGAHLHFEIRKTSNDKLLNPLLFGIKPLDSKYPVIQSVLVIEYDSVLQITNETEYEIIKLNQNTCKLKDTIKIRDKSLSELSLKMYDSMNGSINKNGIYKIKLNSGKNRLHNIQFDSMEFFDSNGIDYLLDKRTKSRKNRIQYLLPLSPYAFPFSFSSQDTSMSNSNEDLITIEVSDLEENITTLKINIQEIEEEHQRKSNLQNYTINSEKPSFIQLENFNLVFPQNSFSSTQAIFVKEIKTNKKKNLNLQHLDMLALEPSYIKLHKDISIYYTSSEFSFDESYCFVHVSDSGKFKLIQNCKNDSICAASISSIENVLFVRDTIPPTITPIFSKQNLSRNSIISFKITDNITPKFKKHLLQYTATLNGQWILFNYDLKSDIISYQLKDSIKIGNHPFELQVTDNQNNTNCYSIDLDIK